MKRLLLLDNRYSQDSNDIKRIANERGWETDRTTYYSVENAIKEKDLVRYYGNTLLWESIKDKVPFWIPEIPDEILPRLSKWTKRKISLMSFGEMAAIDRVKPFFIKPCGEKWFEARVYEPQEQIDGAIKDGDSVYISEVRKFVNEVRCFVSEGKIETSSLYIIDGQVWSNTNFPPEEINFDDELKHTPLKEYAFDIYRETKYSLSPHLVYDFGQDENGDWSLIEFNNPPFCGLYYTDWGKAFEVILAAQRDKRKQITT